MLAMLAGISLLTGCGAADSGNLSQMRVERYVTLGEYKGLAVSVSAAKVDELQWSQYVANLFNSLVTAENGGITDRAVEIGDTVNIDYVGKRDDVAFSGGTANGALLTIGSGKFIDGFEDGLIGVTPGETVDLDLTFPVYYDNAELAGQAVVFTVTLNFILPAEMTDEVVAGSGNSSYSNVDELNQYAYDFLYAYAQSNYENQLENQIVNVFLSSCTFSDIPDSLMERYRENILQSIESTASYYGLSADDYISYVYQMDQETFLDTYAENSAQQSIAFQAVANAEGLNVSDEELEENLSMYAIQAGYLTVDDFIGELDREEYREYFMFEKVLQFLKDNAAITEY